jgi:hypothetical protein
VPTPVAAPAQPRKPPRVIPVVTVTPAQVASPCPDREDDDSGEWKGDEREHRHGPPIVPPGQAKKR